MTKKQNQANAPHLQQLLPQQSLRQPPHNPYYPNLGDNPPPYSDLSTTYAMSHLQQQPARPEVVPFHNPPTIVVQPRPPTILYDINREKRRRHVRKFSLQAIMVALMIIIMAQSAHNLYERRTCVNYVVDKPIKDAQITYNDVREMHKTVSSIAIVILILSCLRCVLPASCYPCYMFAVGLISFIGTVYSGYLAYLAFYSPCVVNMEEILTKGLKTIVAQISDRLPGPEQGLFGERNMFQFSDSDRYGVIIFGLDFVTFICYLSTFLSTF